MTKKVHVVFDGSVFRPSGPVDLKPGKKYTITVKALDDEGDVEDDPAYEIASLAIATNIPDLSTEHDHYLYNMPKRGHRQNEQPKSGRHGL